MKKLFLTLMFILMALPLVNAQFTKIGGGIGYGTGYWFQKLDYDYNRSGHISGFLEGIYEISVPVHVAAGISMFYPHITKEQFSKITVSSMMVDINGHYVFNSLDRIEIYGLAGMDLLFTWKKDKIESATTEVFTENDNAIGLNLGAGTYFKISNQFDLFAEARYIVSKYSQFMINAGIFINVDWLKKHEDDQN